jgi:hypothetical protein
MSMLNNQESLDVLLYLLLELLIGTCSHNIENALVDALE